jgi:hypothetical protein
MFYRVAGNLGMRNDDRIVELFVERVLSAARDRRFTIVERPDHEIRNREAVEAIASDEAGVRIAIEHTLLQVFPASAKTRCAS